MDFRFTPEEEAFRADVKEFLKQELKPGWDDGFDAESELGVEAHGDFAKNFNRKLADRGWLAIAWPEEYGGGGGGPGIKSARSGTALPRSRPGVST